ncbi:fungal transcriptional regulatory protein [Trichoderma velutinum]
MGSDSRRVCHRCAEIKQACDGSMPCGRCLRLSLACQPRDSGSSVNQQVGDLSKARVRRVRTGCLTCKNRRKKCDETKPRCDDCRRLRLDCEWPPKCLKSKTVAAAVTTKAVALGGVPDRSIWQDPTIPINYDSPRSHYYDSLAVSRMTTVSPLSIYNPQLLPQLTPHDRALLNHYIAIVSPLLCRSISAPNPYNDYLLPLACSNNLVMHCIPALSANHWRKLQHQLADRGIYHQSEATQSLAGLLPLVDRSNTDVALVSSLLLLMAELFDGTSIECQPHLDNARRLSMALMNQQQGDVMNGHDNFLVRLTRFLESAATKLTCKPPLMDELEAVMLDSLTLPDDIDLAIYGIPKEWFHLVDVVNSLADKRKPQVDRASEAAFHKEALQIEERISCWLYEYGVMPRTAWTTNMTNNDVLLATMAYEYAIRLHLHQIVKGYDLDDVKVVTNVEGILESVQQIRYGSALEPCLMYPLVMAGSACWTMEQRVIIQDRLLIMERTCGFGYIYNARGLVERVWRMRDQTEGTGTAVNWARIRCEEMPSLAVF